MGFCFIEKQQSLLQLSHPWDGNELLIKAKHRGWNGQRKQKDSPRGRDGRKKQSKDLSHLMNHTQYICDHVAFTTFEHAASPRCVSKMSIT